jgi:hypothetical protein
MQRCYGNGQNAINQFGSMLGEIELNNANDYSIADTVSSHIRQIYSLYKWGNDHHETKFNSKVSADYYPVNNIIKDTISKVIYSYESILPIITRIIRKQYNDLWVYLHYEKYFLCVTTKS